MSRHRRCTRERHHVWSYGRITGGGWSIVRCLMCGLEDIA